MLPLIVGYSHCFPRGNLLQNDAASTPDLFQYFNSFFKSIVRFYYKAPTIASQWLSVEDSLGYSQDANNQLQFTTINNDISGLGITIGNATTTANSALTLAISCPSWQWHRTGSRWSPVRTLPVAPLWCDLGFVPNRRGNIATTANGTATTALAQGTVNASQISSINSIIPTLVTSNGSESSNSITTSNLNAYGKIKTSNSISSNHYNSNLFQASN